MGKNTKIISVEEDGELLFFCLPTIVIKIEKVEQRSWTISNYRNFQENAGLLWESDAGMGRTIFRAAKKSNQEVIGKN